MCLLPFCFFLCVTLSALNMTKRDSSAASLASPRCLRMDSWLAPSANSRQRPSLGASSSSANPGYGDTAPMESVPMPVSGDSWDPSSTKPMHEWSSTTSTSGAYPAVQTDWSGRRPEQEITTLDLRGRFTWTWTSSPTGIFLPWNCGSSGASPSMDGVRPWGLQNCQLLSPLLPNWRSSMHFLSDWAAWASRGQCHPWQMSWWWTSRWRCGWYLYHGHSPENCRPSRIGAPALQISQLAHILYDNDNDTLIRDPEFNAMPQSSSCFRLRHKIRWRVTFASSPARTWPNLAATWRSPPTFWPGAEMQRTSLMMMKTWTFRDRI